MKNNFKNDKISLQLIRIKLAYTAMFSECYKLNNNLQKSISQVDRKSIIFDNRLELMKTFIR